MIEYVDYVELLRIMETGNRDGLFVCITDDGVTALDCCNGECVNREFESADAAERWLFKRR